MKQYIIGIGVLCLALAMSACGNSYLSHINLMDTDRHYINAHGGGILSYGDRYYWFGEHRPDTGYVTEVGITCYSSADLQTWQYEGVALSVSDREGDDTERGCIMERPKVIYNPQTRKFVLWFHLELKDRGYEAARAAVAVSDTPTDPYQYLHSGRINPGKAPITEGDKATRRRGDEALTLSPTNHKSLVTSSPDSLEWWTPEWREAVEQGMYTLRDLEGGQMSRDMTLFVDDDGKAYHIYSSEENLTLQIAELSDDYTEHTGRYIRLFPGGHNEAPTLFKHDVTYWMITSGCTGWKPNEARLFSAPSVWGPWTQHSTPFFGEGADTTFGSQGTYVLTLPHDQYIFMADIWKPESLKYSSYLWLPIRFDEAGTPVITKQ